MMYRRQKKQILFASLLGAIAVVNVLFFFILHYPARSEYSNLRESIARLKGENVASQATIARLEKQNAELDRFAQDRRDMFTTHFIKRESGFAAVLPELEKMDEKAGVRNTHKDFQTEEIPQYGLFSVKAKVPVEGGYKNVVSFIRALETSHTFFLINTIDVKSSGESTGPTATAERVNLLLDVETFFYQ